MVIYGQSIQNQIDNAKKLMLIINLLFLKKFASNRFSLAFNIARVLQKSKIEK